MTDSVSCASLYVIDIYIFVQLTSVNCQSCLSKCNSAHVSVLEEVSRLLETCLSGIHNANYIVYSIVGRDIDPR